MGANANFAATPRVGFAALTAANTARDGSGTLVDLVTGVAAGTRVDQIVFKSTGQPASSVICLFYFDGTTNWLFDEITTAGLPSAASTTVPGWRTSRNYDNLVIAAATHKIRCTVTVAPAAGQINVEAFGGDY